MIRSRYEQYANKNVGYLTEELLAGYYESLISLCQDARKQAEKIKRVETHDSALQYALTCEEILTETERHVSHRLNEYVPYLKDLSVKVDTGHDCAGCKGGCQLNHEVRVLELNATNDMMKKLLSKLQFSTLPLYSETIFPEDYRLLRSNMALLETNLTELFFLENNFLIPGIADAQKQINAGNHAK